MFGGRFDFVSTLRRLANCTVALAALAVSPALGQTAASPGGAAPSAGPRADLPGYAPPSGPLPSNPPPGQAPPATVRGCRARRRWWKCGWKATNRSSCKRSRRISRLGRAGLDKATVEDDVKRLTKTHMFISVEPRYERRPDGGVIIIFHVVERPVMHYVRFYGSSKSQKTLAKKAGLKVGDPLDPYSVEEARDQAGGVPAFKGLLAGHGHDPRRHQRRRPGCPDDRQ